MPLLGDLETSHSFVDANEAEVIVNEYFSYIEDLGLSIDFFSLKESTDAEGLNIANIVESISNRLEQSCDSVVY